MPLHLARPLHGLIVPPHSPFHPDGRLNLGVVEKQAERMLRDRVTAAFVCGSTGESASLTFEERRALAARWIEVAAGSQLQVVVHVGANCLEEARLLAAHAEEKGAAAIAALSPSYFKPRSVEVLTQCSALVAAAAPRTPFYYYDIPTLTGVQFSMLRFLELAHDAIPTLAGLKFTNLDLTVYQYCLHAHGGIWDLPWGMDQHFLGALANGAKGAVGGSYNYSAPIFNRMLAAFARGDLAAARTHQFQGTQTLTVMHRHGGLAAAKVLMRKLGIDVGQVRLPNESLSPAQQARLLEELETLGYFGWIGEN
jgi:N-acetylneuraminate lyase